jgi:hypothetical protein
MDHDGMPAPEPSNTGVRWASGFSTAESTCVAIGHNSFQNRTVFQTESIVYSGILAPVTRSDNTFEFNATEYPRKTLNGFESETGAFGVFRAIFCGISTKTYTMLGSQ